jgi:hypothetical protein
MPVGAVALERGLSVPHDFESFSRQVVASARRPQITIQRRGTLSINRAAFEALGSPLAVELLFDASNQILGLRATSVDAERAYPVRGVGKTPTRYLIAGTAFTKHHHIPTEVSRRWYAEVDGEILFIDLRTEGTEVTSNRRGTGSAN